MDIVKRLRRENRFYMGGLHSDAADEIVRLRGELESERAQEAARGLFGEQRMDYFLQDEES